MKIAICDDEKIFLKKIYEYLWQQPDCSVECFSSPLSLLEKYETGERFNVLFLDIQMKAINGISLAKKIRNYDNHAIIVFLTAYVEYAPAGYEINAFRYLLKPICSTDISNVMKDIRNELKHSNKIVLKTPLCELILCTDEISYLEANDKETTIYYEKDSCIVRKSLNEYAELLPRESFFRIHRKYMVNLSHVREFDDRQLTLDCGMTLPISRRNSGDFRSALELYIEGGLHR